MQWLLVPFFVPDLSEKVNDWHHSKLPEEESQASFSLFRHTDWFFSELGVQDHTEKERKEQEHQENIKQQRV